MKKIIVFCIVPLFSISAYAQDYPHWPADKPEVESIKQSQSKQNRLEDLILPQEIDMQDKMRVALTLQMKYCAKKLGWDMVELSEYTNDNALQGGRTPYALRSPRGIEITFQFIVSSDSLQAWKKYQVDFNNRDHSNIGNDYSNIQSVMASPKYKEYHDSVNYYMILYTNYVEAHKHEGADLYTKDKHPKYYQQRENAFINKMTAMTDERHEHDGVEKFEDEGIKMKRRFRNHTVVEITFHANNFTAEPISQTLGPIAFTSASYLKSDTKVSRIFAIPENQENGYLVKWNYVILMLLGNFQTKRNEAANYDAGFNHNGQGDEHTLKTIKSDKVQNISVMIKGDKKNIKKIAGLIDVNKLNSLIYKK
jgi:hypothetical protein